MFTVELKINGVLIGVLYGHNTGVTDESGNTLYRCTYQNISDLKKARAFRVIHKRSEGLEKLTEKAFIRLGEEL